MASQDDYDQDDENGTDGQDNPRTVTLPRNQIRSLERNGKRADEAESRAADLERKLAFVEAGIKPSDPKMSYFVKGYDGELTTEAITKAATEAGFLAPPTEDTDAQTKQELAAHDRVSAASAGTASRLDDDVTKLREAAATGGRDAILAEIARSGRAVITG